MSVTTAADQLPAALAEAGAPVEEKTFSVPCRRCGLPVVLKAPNTGWEFIDRVLVKWARSGVLHASCHAEHTKFSAEKDAADLLVARQAEWRSLCEPYYFGCASWFDGRNKELNAARHRQALGWRYQAGGKGLLLFGERTGTGKTASAWAVLEREHAWGRTIAAMTHTELAREALLQFGRSDGERRRWVAALMESDILFLDDLGKASLTTLDGKGKMAEELLFDVLDTRMRNGRPTVITTNMRSEALARACSPDRAEPLRRRLREGCECVGFDNFKEAACQK